MGIYSEHGPKGAGPFWTGGRAAALGMGLGPIPRVFTISLPKREANHTGEGKYRPFFYKAFAWGAPQGAGVFKYSTCGGVQQEKNARFFMGGTQTSKTPGSPGANKHYALGWAG